MCLPRICLIVSLLMWVDNLLDDDKNLFPHEWKSVDLVIVGVSAENLLDRVIVDVRRQLDRPRRESVWPRQESVWLRHSCACVENMFERVENLIDRVVVGVQTRPTRHNNGIEQIDGRPAATLTNNGAITFCLSASLLEKMSRMCSIARLLVCRLSICLIASLLCVCRQSVWSCGSTISMILSPRAPLSSSIHSDFFPLWYDEPWDLRISMSTNCSLANQRRSRHTYSTNNDAIKQWSTDQQS